VQSQRAGGQSAAQAEAVSHLGCGSPTWHGEASSSRVWRARAYTPGVYAALR